MMADTTVPSGPAPDVRATYPPAAASSTRAATIATMTRCLVGHDVEHAERQDEQQRNGDLHQRPVVAKRLAHLRSVGPSGGWLIDLASTRAYTCANQKTTPVTSTVTPTRPEFEESYSRETAITDVARIRP